MAVDRCIFAKYMDALGDVNPLCENEDVALVEDVANSFELGNGKRVIFRNTSKEIFDDPPEDFKLLVGDTWLETICYLLETSLKELTEPARNGYGYPNLLDNISKIMLTTSVWIITNGPTKLTCFPDRRVAMLSGNSQLISDIFGRLSNVDRTIVLAIGIVGYYINQGRELDCPFAELIVKLTNIGFYSFFPKYSLEDFEEVRPILKKCKEHYEDTTCLREIFEQIFLRDEYDDNIILETSVGTMIFAKMLEEEWGAPKASNGELENEDPDDDDNDGEG